MSNCTTCKKIIIPGIHAINPSTMFSFRHFVNHILLNHCHINFSAIYHCILLNNMVNGIRF